MFASVDRGWARDLAAARGFGDAPVHRDVLEQQADDAVVGLQRDCLQLGEDLEFGPLVAAVADRARGAGAVRDPLVGTAEPQHLHQLVEHDPIWDPATMTPQRMGRVEHRPSGQQRGELVPQRVDRP